MTSGTKLECERRCVAQRLAIAAQPGVVSIEKFEGLDPMRASLYPLADLFLEEETVTVKPLPHNDVLIPAFAASHQERLDQGKPDCEV
jgi:hypothetical protein